MLCVVVKEFTSFTANGSTFSSNFMNEMIPCHAICDIIGMLSMLVRILLLMNHLVAVQNESVNRSIL